MEPEWVRNMRTHDNSWTAPVVAVAAVALLALAFVPRPVLAITAGVVFGPVVGAVYVVAGSVLAAAIGFSLGRLIGGRPAGWLLRSKRMGHLATKTANSVERHGVVAVAASRMLPFLPFCAVNVAMGATKLRVTAFIAGTALGVAPTTVAYAAMGNAVHDPLNPVVITSGIAGLLLVGAMLIVARRSTVITEPACPRRRS